MVGAMDSPSMVRSMGLPRLTGCENVEFISRTRPSTKSDTYWNERVCLPWP